jgi:putative salt-induced outer membrane protein YdiY
MLQLILAGIGFSQKTHPDLRGRLIAARCLLAFLPLTLLADQVVMKNGDRVTGSIVKQDGKSITIKTDVFGVVTAPWDQVVSIQSEKPVHVVLQDGRTIEGALSTSDGRVRVAASGAPVDVAPAAVTAIRNADEQKAYERMLRPGLLQLWSGSGSVGMAGANGNAKTLTFTTGFTAARATRTDKFSLYFNAIKASSSVNNVTSNTAQAVRGGWGYDRNTGSRLFVNLFNDYEYDHFQNLDLRFVLGGGFGWRAVKGERANLSVLGGADYNHSNFSTPLIRNAAEAYWGDDYSLKLGGATSVVQSFRMFDDLTNAGAYRVSADVGLATKLKKWLTWNISLSDRYLSNPAPTRKSNDWLYTTGVGVTFAR